MSDESSWALVSVRIKSDDLKTSLLSTARIPQAVIGRFVYRDRTRCGRTHRDCGRKEIPAMTPPAEEIPRVLAGIPRQGPPPRPTGIATVDRSEQGSHFTEKFS